LIAAVLVAWAGTLYGAYLWGSNQGPSDSMTAAGRELSADDRLDAAVQAAGRELSADDRFDAAVRAAGHELSADERLDAFIRASRELSARNAAGREQMRAATIQAAADNRLEVWSLWSVVVGVPVVVVAINFALARWVF